MKLIEVCAVQRNHVGVPLIDERYVDTLPPGDYAFGKSLAATKVVEVDLRETIRCLGQDILTGDKVTLRLNPS